MLISTRFVNRFLHIYKYLYFRYCILHLVIPAQDVNTNVNLTETTGVHNTRPGCSIRIPEQNVTPINNVNNPNQDGPSTSDNSNSIQVAPTISTQVYNPNYIPRPTGIRYLIIICHCNSMFLLLINLC